MGWNVDVFNNFVKLNRGFDLPGKNIIHGEYPVVASTSVKDYHKDYKVNPPCVVTGRSGSLGSVQFISAKCWPLNTTLYVKDFKGNIPKFVYYFLKEMHLDNFNSGAGVPTLNQNHLHKLKIKIPDPPLQKKIAAVLSAYDDLIENNNRRIAILEKMAEQLYREWFVRLRFPGHAKVKIVKGVPEGWEVKRFGEIVNANPTMAIRKGDSVDRIEMEDVYPQKKYAYSKTKRIYTGNGSKFTEGDTIFARITPCLENRKIAKVSNSIHNGIGSTEFFVFRCVSNISTENYVYYQCKSNQVVETAVNSMTGASGRQRADLAAIKKIFVLYPPLTIQETYEAKIKPIDKHIQIIQDKTEILVASRDRLRSRLMSGKLDVENLDIRFPKSMEESIA